MQSSKRIKTNFLYYKFFTSRTNLQNKKNQIFFKVHRFNWCSKVKKNQFFSDFCLRNENSKYLNFKKSLFFIFYNTFSILN